MKTIIFLAVASLIAYVLVKVMSKEPLLPTGKKKRSSPNPSVKPKRKSKQKQQENNSTEEMTPETFRRFLDDAGVEDIIEHMIRLRNNEFVLIAEVHPVNYFLLSEHEQEAIDKMFETWTAQLDYNVKIYIQNRYMDLSAPIEEIQRNMRKAEDLPYNTIQYGMSLLEDLQQWQSHTPRYETKRYILFPYKVEANKIDADSPEELEERILNKAFQTLFRRFNTAKSALQKGKIEVEMLTTDGIIELLYYTFNRKKAVKNKYKDIRNRENLALYVTADQDLARIEEVKEMIESYETEKDEETSYKDQAL